VNNSLSAEAGRAGDVIVVPVARTLAATDVVPSNESPEINVAGLDHKEVRLDNWKKAAFALTDREMGEIEARAEFVPLQMANAIQALADAVNQSIFDLAPYFDHEIGEPGQTPFQKAEADDEINLLFINDMRLARQICRRLYADFSSFPPDRQAALLSMAFNLGAPRLAKFHKMRTAIAADDWQAAAEALASKWAGQLPRWAAEIARLLRG